METELDMLLNLAGTIWAICPNGRWDAREDGALVYVPRELSDKKPGEPDKNLLTLRVRKEVTIEIYPDKVEPYSPNKLDDYRVRMLRKYADLLLKANR